MATQRRHQSRQDYATPDDFIQAAKRRLGIPEFVLDLAAHSANTKAMQWLGPGSALGVEDALAPGLEWTALPRTSVQITPAHLGIWSWLNPPFDDIYPWAYRCRRARDAGANVAFLVPASTGAEWFVDHVAGHARVLFLQGRIHFDPTNPGWGYPKDCVLCLFSPWLAPGYEAWTWKPVPRPRIRYQPPLFRAS